MPDFRIEITHFPGSDTFANGAIEEIRAARNQREAADVYASAIRLIEPCGPGDEWRRINVAVMERWPKGLQRVKAMAWKIAEERERQSKAVRDA